MNTYGFHKYLIEFPKYLKYKIYDDKYCCGIKFFDKDYTYDVTYNRQVDWYRIIIYGKDGSMRDIPFNDRTVELLPKNITLRTYGEYR